MLATLRRLNIPPRFESEERTQRARMVHVVALSAMTIVTALTLAMLVAQPEHRVRMLGLVAFVQALGLLVLEANRRGRVVLAATGIVAGIVATIAAMALPAGGVLSPGVSMYSVLVLMAGILLGERAGVITAIVCAAIGLALVLLDATGYLPAQTVFYRPVARWILFCVYMAMVVVLLKLANEAIGAAMRRVETELRERRAAQHELATSNADLAKRVEELGLLHDASQLLRNRSFDPTILDEIVRLIPRAWQYPEVCAARITYGDVDARSPGFRDSRWRQTVTFATAESDGIISIVYLEERPPAAEGPFLAEERSVLLSLGDMLAAWLERDVAERRRKSVEEQLRQSQKMEALGTLAGGIAHDFNNIIGAIVGQADLGKAEAGAQHQSAKAFDAILAATRRASDIVNRILLFSRRQEAERNAMTLRSVVEEAVKLLQGSLPRNVQVRSSFSPELPEISGDASQLFQVVMNLATNAAHAMTAGGGILTIAVDAMELNDTASILSVDLDPGPHVRLTVSDTGTGMSPETRDRLFEPFFTTKGLTGTGLGMSVVHGIVKDHEGAITVDSTVGTGTVVSVYFPVAQPTPAPAPQPAAPDSTETLHGNGEHVMYVDDDEAIGSILSRVIRRYGYRCSTYTDPHAALRDFRDSPHSFDAVLTDFAMPTMTGIVLAQQLREIHPAIPIALVSGYGVDADTAAAAGIDLRIAKPVSIEVLARALRQMLQDGVPA
ncbi:MAG: ATP-binding protein [Gemmatimonadaceae bacterium]